MDAIDSGGQEREGEPKPIQGQGCGHDCLVSFAGSVGWLAALVGCCVGWLVGWLVDSLFDWLID